MGIIGRLEIGKNLERTVEEMEVNEKAYIHPEAIMFDYSQTPYLDLNAHIYPIPSTLLENKEEKELLLPIIRTGNGKSDYDIDIRHTPYKWKRDDLLSENDDEDPEKYGYVKLDYNSDTKKNKNIFVSKNSLSTDDSLELKLSMAIEIQDYEEAARLRDDIRKRDGLSGSKGNDSTKDSLEL